MPTISYFYGITILMRYNDHPPPHFHAVYQGFEALVQIENGEVIAGVLPRTAARYCPRLGDCKAGRAYGGLAKGAGSRAA
jgi:Domain of unknown function (DUF4160)